MLNECSSLVHVKMILRWFKLTSGLKVNFYKISLVGINLDEDYTNGMTNVIYWKYDTLSKVLLEFPSSFSFTNLLWKSIATPKIEMFLWLVLQDKVCTGSLLLCRNLLQPNQALCFLCQIEIEHVHHLFLHCHVSWKVWNHVMA